MRDLCLRWLGGWELPLLRGRGLLCRWGRGGGLAGSSCQSGTTTGSTSKKANASARSECDFKVKTLASFLMTKWKGCPQR